MMDTGAARLATHVEAFRDTTPHDTALDALHIGSDPACMPLSQMLLPSGTLIETPDGFRTVEALAPGSAISLFHGNLCTVSHLLRVEPMRSPVQSLICIRADAFSAGVPQFDLMVPADATLLLHGKAVHVRCLLNEASILSVSGEPGQICYLIETETAGQVKAHGVITGPTLTPIAPRNFVEPLYHALVARAQVLGYGAGPRPQTLRYDPDLRLRTDTGRIVHPARQTRDKVVFLLDAPVTHVTIVTRADRPSETIGPFVDDHRMLGILVGTISVYDGNGCHELQTHLTEGDLGGWNPCDSEIARWTSGDAILPLHTREAAVLTLQICAGGPYRSNEPLPT